MSNAVGDDIPGLVFRFTQLMREARALRSIGSEFFDLSTDWALDRFMDDLASIWSASGGTPNTLQLNHVRTIQSSLRGNDLYAEISGNWELTPLGDRSPKERIRNQREVVFSGIASTRLELYLVGQADRIAMWRFELGAVDSPGCYFHAQVLGDSACPPFPDTVEIPRLPSFFVTPMAAVDYVLGEVFGSEWEKAAETNTYDAPFWRSLQRDRLNRQFSWYQQTIEDTARSPWVAMKTAKPQARMFV